jgi:hypothetical protein
MKTFCMGIRMKRMKMAVAACAAITGMVAVDSVAGNLEQIGTLAQSQFLMLATDLGAAASYKGVTPATPLGLSGIDVGVELAQTRLENASAFRQAGAGDISNLYVPKLHITKGLPFNVDIGAFVSRISGVDGSLIGAELRYAVIDDGLTTPALGVRLSGTRLAGVSHLDLSTVALDAMLSKKLAFITPYIGAGSVRTQSRAGVAGLHEENINKSRVFIGVNANFLVANVAVEAEKLGANSSLSAKLGFRF